MTALSLQYKLELPVIRYPAIPYDQIKKIIAQQLQIHCQCPNGYHAHTTIGLNIFIDIQTSKTLIQMDINKMMKMEWY